MKTKLSCFAVALLASATLSGCLLAPGQHLRQSDVSRSQRSDDGRLEMVTITPKLIAMDRATQAEQVLPADLFDYQPQDYRVGVGDVLYVTVWDHPELTVPAGSQQQGNLAGRLVQSDGSFFYPYIGKVVARDRTPVQLREEITQRLAKYIESPQVDVSVLNYGSQRIWVTGAAERSTPISLGTSPLTLADAISQGGLNPTQADLSGVRLSRAGVTYTINLETLANQYGGRQLYLKDGDSIFVPYLDRKEIFVVGEVNLPGAYSFRTGDVSLNQALGRARGLTQATANGNAVYVIRGSHDLIAEPSMVYQLEARSPTAFAVGSQFMLQPGDVVFIGAAGVTRWNRFVNQLLPFTSILYTAARTENEVGSN
ncbi:polysaccharide biosynthesis/export family protein [Stenotrophomonas sp. CFBP 13724]|jgi:polysaccharide export outer membrane protein|uniref:polysaccharide biosynthesis/export family protein n=1 Tax=Stenotrophomonas sp. CFBP 13724 TaxID=2775298 RepID=UPI0017849AE8|nr:polysaccharide biosynthesis/export family protein [Stenotrophomonas sp. CFBP 13724]MBD8643459.1 polysaccharide biosynthesis/export family protein [Stenotrophomonas sp. CFBP 13724]